MEQSKSFAWLRIVGESVIPDEVTRLLGCEPTRAWSKGDFVRSKRPGPGHVARVGTWFLRVDEREPENFNEQIAEILSRLNSHPDAWAYLASNFSITLSCLLDASEENQAFTISPVTLSALGNRGIELRVYCSIDDTDRAAEISERGISAT
jgi:Domain of unknown function (DUF4279)